MKKPLVMAAIVLSPILLPIAAFAPPMVANELAAQRALGYNPCEPVIGQIPTNQNPNGKFLAWAGGTNPGEVCSIQFSSTMPFEDLEWVPWHEVCHLSTLNQIMSDPNRPIIDPAHTHADFRWCIAQGPSNTGGY